MPHASIPLARHFPLDLDHAIIKHFNLEVFLQSINLYDDILMTKDLITTMPTFP